MELPRLPPSVLGHNGNDHACHGTKVSIRLWVLIIFEMVASKNGVAGREIERKYGLCSRTAWFVMHRIREVMAGGDGLLWSMRGVIVSDETWIGGNPQRMHVNKRPGVQGKTFKTPRPLAHQCDNWRGPFQGRPERNRPHSP
jgi:hypothetical protein